MALAFVLRAERVLILTPSRLVREQIAENFSALVDLKRIEALPLDLATLRVFATEGNLRGGRGMCVRTWTSGRASDPYDHI
jgi:hypothetical protein